MATRAQKFISFYIGDQQYALPIMYGNKFIEFNRLTAIPQVDKDILGLIYQGGNIITILDIKRILKIKSLNQNIQQICLMFEVDDYHYGILVDQGGETISANRTFTDRQKKIFKKYIKTKDKAKVYILEPDDILAQINIL
ncbi:MAG: hypothetical protein HOE19_00255 [Candidatus Komeilibacteria bacterium]|jgi:purine-binding chemotaxis protein CheW|nr:hypothetical protein [Candidatus Komeilibacteria bacterium]MBT4448040.1 hypothetical protein [Candidatus Komeilibacteria bacterium]